jgi:hypothetical protein
MYFLNKELDSPAVSAMQIAEVKQRSQSHSSDGCPKICYLELIRASKGRKAGGLDCICSR